MRRILYKNGSIIQLNVSLDKILIITTVINIHRYSHIHTHIQTHTHIYIYIKVFKFRYAMISDT